MSGAHELSAPSDRRQSQRIAAKGTAMFHVGAALVRGRIENISSGGILVATESPGSADLVGDDMTVELRLDARSAGWLQVHGRITRVSSDSIAASFRDAPPPFSAMLHEMVPASGRHRRAMNVVLVDEVPERRRALSRVFRQEGCTVLETSSPLEFLVRLGEQSFEPDVIAIADSIPSATSHQLRTFIEQNHPDAQLLTIGRAADRDPESHAGFLSFADPAPDIAARIHALLSRRMHSH
jgi:CheY-like chemotaxis protein